MITCNGTDVDVDGATIAELLVGHLGDARPPGTAVAVNGEVVARTRWTDHVLHPGDVVELVTAVQGG